MKLSKGAFLKEFFSGIFVNIVIVLLFIFFYFFIPDYWFLCSLLTLIIYGCVDVFLYQKKKRKK